MDNELYELLDGMTAEELLAAGDLLNDIAQQLSLPEDTVSRIHSSVIRKAGFEMKETTVKKTRRHSKRFAALAAAAVIAVTGAIGAGAYLFVDRSKTMDTVYGDGAGEKLSSSGLLSDKQYSGEHFDVTVDACLSDGKLFSLVLSVTPNDEIGEQYMKSLGDFEVDEALTYDDPHFDGNGCGQGYEGGQAVIHYESAFNAEYTDPVIPFEVYYYASEEAEKNDEMTKIVDFELEVTKNVESTAFTSENGETVNLCDYGYTVALLHFDENADEDKISDYLEDITFEYADATSGTVDPSFSGYYYDMENHVCEKGEVGFDSLIDSSSVTAVTINGVRFSK